MKEKIIEVLRQQLKSSNETLERLNQLLKEVQEDRQKILSMFTDFYKDDIEQGNNVLEVLFNDIKTKYQLAPNLNHLLISKKLYYEIYNQTDQGDQYAFSNIKEFAKKHFPNFEAIVENSIDCLGQEIDKDDKEDIVNKLKKYELINIQKDRIDSNQNKNKEHETFLLIKKQEMDALKKSQENAIKDLEEMNCKTVKQYFFVSAELQWIQFELQNDQLENNKYDFNAQIFPRTFQLIKLIDNGKQFDPEVIKAFDQMKNGKDVKRNILVLKKRICGIDFNELFRMLAQARQFQKQQMRNIEKSNRNSKKIKAVSFFGLSKVGKSTLIKCLMGYKMKQTRICGIPSIQVQNPQQIKSEHESIQIGASNKSTTRIPRLYLLPKQNILEEDLEEDIYLFDCPGAEDSESIEVEISNRITTIEALKQVNQLFIAIVISDKMKGVSGQGFEKLARAVEGFVRDYNEIQKSIFLIFNGGNDDYLDTFYSVIRDIRKNIKGRNNYALSQNFEAFFDHLEDKSKKKCNMFHVNPLTLNVQDFLKQIPAKGIRNCQDALDGRIGERCDKQVESSVQRLKLGFQECFENDDIQGASYYFAILHKIVSQPKISLFAGRQIIKIGKQMIEKIQENIKDLRKQFQNLKILRMKKQNREKQMKNLRAKHQKLKKNLQKISKFQKKTLQNKEIYDKIHQKLKDVIQDSEKWFINEMQKWKQHNLDLKEVSEMTEICQEFLTCFGLNKEQFNKSIDQIRQGILSEMKQHFKKRQNNHKMKQNLQKLMCIDKLLNNQINIPLKSQIKQQYGKLKKQISIINWIYLYKQSMQKDVLVLRGRSRLDNDNENQIQKINSFLNFIAYMKGYPQEMKQNQHEMTKVQVFLLKNIPEFFISKLDEIIQGKDKDQKDKITYLEEIIKNLRLLDNIEAIKTYQKDKISSSFSNLEQIFEKGMKKIQKIKQAFKKDNIDEIKKDFQIVTKQMNRIKDMANATGKNQSKKQIENLQKNFEQDIITFINRNTFGQKLVLSKHESIQKNILKLNKLIQFKQIFKMPNQKMNEKLISIIQDGQNKILDPIRKLSEQILKGKVFQCNKLNRCFVYYQTCKQQCQTLQKGNLLAALQKAMQQLKDNIKNIYQNTIQIPTKQLIKQLLNQKKKQMNIQGEKIQKLFGNNQKINEYKKALKKLKEMQILNPQNLDINILQLKNQIQDAVKQFVSIQINKIKDGNLSISALNSLQQIVDTLKDIQRSFLNDYSSQRQKIDTFQLKKLYDSIYLQKSSFKDIQKSCMERFEKIQQIDDLKHFDHYTFTTAYKQFEKDKSINGTANVKKLQKYLRFYLYLAKNKGQELNSEIQGNPLDLSLDYENCYIGSLRFIQQIMKKLAQIKSGAPQSVEECKPDFKNFYSISQKLFDGVIESVIKFCDEFGSEINGSKNEDIKKKQKFLSTINQNIIKISNHVNQDFNIEIYDNFKKQKQFKGLNEIIQKKINEKDKKLKQFVEEKEFKILENLKTTDFNNIYNSLDTNQNEKKQEIKKKLNNEITAQKQKINKLMTQKYDQYAEKIKIFSENIKKLPFELQNLHNKDILELQKSYSEQQELIKQEIQCCQIQSNLKQTIKISQKIDKLANPKYIQYLIIFIKKNLIKPQLQKTYFDYLKNQIWQNKEYRKNVNELTNLQLKQSLKLYEEKIIENVQKQLLQEWAFIQKYKSSQNYDGRISPSQSFISSSSRIQERKIENSVDYIRDFYHSLTKQIKKNGVNQNYEKMQKIIETRTNETINEMKQVIKNIEENKNYDYLTQDKCQKFYNLKQILVIMLSKKKSQQFMLIFEKQIQQLLNKFRTFQQRISNKVQQNLTMNYQFYNEKLKNSTDQQIEKYVYSIETDFLFLSNIQNVYNKYIKFDNNKQIRMQEIIDNFKIIMNKAQKQHQETLNKIFENITQGVNQKIGIIPKIFDKLNDIKKKALFNLREQINTHQITINQLIKNKVQQQKYQIKNNTKNLITLNQKLSSDYKSQTQKLKQQNRQKLQLIKMTYKMKINQIENQFKMTTNDNTEKQKIQNQKKAQLATNQSQKQKKQFQISMDQQEKLKKFLQKQDEELKQKFQNMAQSLIKCKKMQYINETTQKSLEQTIEDSCKKILKDQKLGKKFYQVLANSENNFAILIIGQRNQFAKFRNQQFQQLTQKTNNCQQIINQMFTSNSITKQQAYELQKYYNKFDKKQKQYIEQYQKQKNNKIISKLAMNIKQNGRKMKTDIQNSKEIKKTHKVQLLAQVFAMWSISSSEKEKSNDGSVVICYKAHAAQVICILILIAIQSKQVKGQVINKNRLAQVKTGQGKSIVLAMLSIYFALCGYEVDCICYSSILSKRDQSDFEDLFKKCGVQSKISYGVFQVAIKKILNQQNSENQVNATFQQFILKSVTSEISNTEALWNFVDKIPLFNNFRKFFSESFGKKLKNKILIIDEIDVLFNKKYFGDTFNLSIDLRDESIVNLLQFIWQRKDNITVKIVLDSPEFKAVKNKFPALKPVLKNQVYGMILALKTYKEQQSYIIKDQTIYYKVQDKYCQNVSYRYNTTYLYCQQYQKNRVSQSAKMKNMVINLCVSEFSYACILEYYTHILGVTGTLTCLPQYIKDFMDKNFDIKKEEQKYVIPSVYGQNKGKKIPPICTSRENYYDKIIQNIQEVFEKEKRPILIFFKTKTDLINFFNSEKYKDWQKFTLYFTEQHSEHERNDRIYRCSFKNSITLMTETFIRGTDFKLIDKSSQKAGGFHAIVTYLIDNTADYIQALGRVGRQGKPGSFIEIFMKDDFEFLGLNTSQESILKISDARITKQDSEKQSILERISISKKKNEETLKVFQDKNISLSKLVDYILKNNLFPEVSFSDTKIKMILMIDATGSMGNLFVQLKSILPQIFQDVYATLAAKGVKGCLQLQILQYRNYNSLVQNLLQCSPVEITAQNLKMFIDKSVVSGGWGNQAIQVALQYANSLKEVRQIFLFGDARGNTRQEVIQKRSKTQIYEKERLQKGYYPTTTQEQLNNLVKNKISVNTFCLSHQENVNQYFKNLSNSTNGKYHQIKLHLKNSSMLITTAIVQRVLTLIGSKSDNPDQSNALLQQYKKILSKRMNKTN